jgi:hypothetical protein
MEALGLIYKLTNHISFLWAYVVYCRLYFCFEMIMLVCLKLCEPG